MMLRLTGCALLALGSLAVEGCHSGHVTQAAPAAQVYVARVLIEPTRSWDDFNGLIRAIDAAEVRPRVSGYIQRVAFTEGEFVHRGDLLFVIDPRPYRAALGSATAQLEHARATNVLALAQDRRAQTLMQAKASSDEEVEIRRANYVQSQADIHAAEAAVATANLNLDFTEVRAPFDGRASRAMLTVGNLAVADQSLLTSVVSLDPVYVYFDPDEQSYLSWRYNSGVRQGQPCEVRIGLANEIDYPHVGTVDFLDNQLDASTGTVHARAVLRNHNHVLEPGLFARVRLAAGKVADAMLIDDKAILTDQDRKYVYVLGHDGRAMRKEVQLGRLSDGLRVVESGLSADDRVVVEGLQRILFPGAPLEAHEIPMRSTVAHATASNTRRD